MSTPATRHHEQEEISINLTRLDARVGVLESGIATMVVKIESLYNLFNASRQTNWPAVVGVASLALGLIGGAWVIIDLKSQNALMPVLIQNAISTKEREEIRGEVLQNRGALAQHGTEIARLGEKFREIEGQFKTLGQDHNLSVAEQHRLNYLMWNATEKLGTYPQGPHFFPSFSQHLPKP
jgi:hypothetical protein